MLSLQDLKWALVLLALSGLQIPTVAFNPSHRRSSQGKGQGNSLWEWRKESPCRKISSIWQGRRSCLPFCSTSLSYRKTRGCRLQWCHSHRQVHAAGQRGSSICGAVPASSLKHCVLWHPHGRGEESILQLHIGSAMHVPKALWLWAQGGLGAVQTVPVSPGGHPTMGDLEVALIFGSAAATRLNSAPILGI